MGFLRQEILTRLRSRVAEGKPIIGFGAGSGLTATAAEKGGVDYISIYGTAICRIQGLPSMMSWLPYENVNRLLMETAPGILPLILETPVFAGVGAHDPRIDLSNFIDKLISIGFSGINNEPFCSQYGEEFAAKLEDAGIGFSREVELIRIACEKNIFTFAWVANEYEAREMAKAGVDMIGVMARLPKSRSNCSLNLKTKKDKLKHVSENIERMILAARQINSDVLVIAHGDPLHDVEAVQYSLLHSHANGYSTGSDGERIPTTKAICRTVERFQAMRLNEN